MHVWLHVQHDCISTKVMKLTSTEEPWFDNVAKLCMWNFIIQHLYCMVPSHTTKRTSASNEDDFSLNIRRSCLRSHAVIINNIWIYWRSWDMIYEEDVKELYQTIVSNWWWMMDDTAQGEKVESVLFEKKFKVVLEFRIFRSLTSGWRLKLEFWWRYFCDLWYKYWCIDWCIGVLVYSCNVKNL